jgi:peroxiredoxin
VVFLALTSSRASGFRQFVPGDPVPEFSLVDVTGKPLRSADFKGRPLVLVFVKPDQQHSYDCLNALRELEGRFQRAVGIAVVAEAADKPALVDLRAFSEEKHLAFPIAYDVKDGLYERLGLYVFPVTVIADAKGRFAYEYAGCRDDYVETVAARVAMVQGTLTEEEWARRKAAPAAPDDAEKKAATMTALADKLAAKGFVDSAERQYRQAIATDSRCVAAYVGLGKLHAGAGQAADARAAFAQALAIDPTNLPAKDGLAALGQAAPK